MFIKVCDECGAKGAETYCLITGYAYIDGKLHGQSLDLCREHYPPNECKRVQLHYPGFKKDSIPTTSMPTFDLLQV